MNGGTIDRTRLLIFNLITTEILTEFVFEDHGQIAKALGMKFSDYVVSKINEILKYYDLSPTWIDIVN